MRVITLQPGETIQVQAPNAGPVPPDPNPDPGPGPGPDPQPPSGGVHVLEIPWSNSGNIPAGNLPKGEVLAVKVTTGSISSTNSLPRIKCAEWNSPPRDRLAVLSFTPGDFDHPIGNAAGATMQGQSPTAIFAVGTGAGMGYYPVVPLNTTVYLNIKTIEDDDDQSREMFASLAIGQL